MRALALGLALAVASTAQAADEAAEVEASSTTTTGTEFPRIHLAVAGGYEFFGAAVVPEFGATFGATRFFDVGAAVTLGTSVAAHLVVGLHTSWSDEVLLRPFLQLRGTASFGSMGFGGGAWAGAEVELGPGRLKLGPAGYWLTAAPGYRSFAVLAMLGYELDLLRPGTKTVERVVVKETTREPPPPLPPPSRPTLLRAKLVDLEDRPVNGTLRFANLGGRERLYDAAPSVEVELAPGEYRVEAEAPGYLIRGKTLTVEAGETVDVELVLRPVPKVKTATLAESEVTISNAIQFEFGKATILEESAFILEEVADVLLRHPELRQIRVEGHTDDVGTAEANERLSEDRAVAVTAALVGLGVEANRLAAQGFGRSKPLTSNKTEAGRAKNRRVQFKIIRR